MAMSMVTRWDTAVDIGAHVGFMSRDMAKFFKTVHAFEPHPDNFSCLQENTPDNVICHNAGVSDSNRRAGMKSPAPINSGAWEVCDGDAINLVKLDDLDIGRVDFMKIDVQGHELEVLRGAERILCEDSPTIIIEIVDNAEAYRLLRESGYRPFYKINDDYIMSKLFADKVVENVEVDKFANF